LVLKRLESCPDADAPWATASTLGPTLAQHLTVHGPRTQSAAIPLSAAFVRPLPVHAAPFRIHVSVQSDGHRRLPLRPRATAEDGRRLSGHSTPGSPTAASRCSAR
jgi:hypothetical protein